MNIDFTSYRFHCMRTGITLLLILHGLLSYAQKSNIVRGTVISEGDHAPLHGVTVMVKNTTIGTTTDIKGKYSIKAEPEDTLTFRYMGYLSRNIPVSDQTEINIAMIASETALNRVVVVAYGTQKKASITGSVTSIDEKEIKTISSTNLVTGLAGKLPGLRVIQRTGEPGAYDTQFDIRGFGAPLIVIDGIVSRSIDFTRLDPNDIASISVLKDASAAVYGTKAANGVILVTTKKGIRGKPQITYSGSYSFQIPTNTPEVSDAYQYAVLTTESEINGGRAPGATTYTKEDLQRFKDGTYPSTDWSKVVARNYSALQRHNLSVTGGNEDIKYFTSLGMINEMGLWKSGDLNYKRYNVRANVTGTIARNLEAEISIDGELENKNEPGEPAWNIFKFMWMNKPTYPVYANNTPGYLQDMTYPWHPLAMSTANIGGYTRTQYKKFNGIFTLNYTIPFIKGLNAKVMYGFNTQDNFQKAWRKKYSTYDYDKVTDSYVLVGSQNDPSNLTEIYRPYQKSSVTGQLSYKNVFSGEHHVKASLVFEERHDKTDDMWAKKEFSIDVDQFFAGNALNSQVTSNGLIEDDNQNVIGKFNYGYMSKYLAEFGFNYGGSSKFPVGKRWGFFPYVSAGWRISEEDFFKKEFPFITSLKVRGSWGQMGDDGALSFQFLTGYNYPSGSYVFGDKVVSGLGFRGMPNPNITWYTVTTKNIGFDLDIKDGLITTQIDFFQRDRSGLLGTRLLTIPGTVGADLPQENLNSDMRRGFEIVLGHAKRTGDFQYSVSAHTTYTRGQVTYKERPKDGNSYLRWRNDPVNRWDNIAWGYHYIGQFRSYEEIYNSPLQDDKGNTTLRPGDLKYEDVNKDGIIDGLDLVPIGRSFTPDINFGLSANISWKGFDLNLLFQGAANFNLEYRGYLKTPLRWGRNSLSQFMDRWHREDLFDPESPWEKGYFPSTNGPASNDWSSEFWSPDASYLRLKNMEIGYTRDILINNSTIPFRIYIKGFNMFTWSKVKFLDPEEDSDPYHPYPLMKVYTLGVNIKF